MSQHETATFGAGCFWGVEAAFARVPGVLTTAVGYMGGTVEHPTYQQVCTDTTGHAEVVQVTFDPEAVSFQALLAVFWKIHDPTQHNRQGPDVGRQYRSVIFYHNPVQLEAAQSSIQSLESEKRYPRAIATTLEPAATFWRAEAYHQRYFERHPVYCHI